MNQYMGGIICDRDTPSADNMCRLQKGNFDGRIAEDLELLEQMCAEDQAAVQGLDKKTGSWKSRYKKKTS